MHSPFIILPVFYFNVVATLKSLLEQQHPLLQRISQRKCLFAVHYLNDKSEGRYNFLFHNSKRNSFSSGGFQSRIQCDSASFSSLTSPFFAFVPNTSCFSATNQSILKLHLERQYKRFCTALPRFMVCHISKRIPMHLLWDFDV